MLVANGEPVVDYFAEANSTPKDEAKETENKEVSTQPPKQIRFKQLVVCI